MIYKQSEPSSELSSIIKSFWLIDSEGDASIHQQKIIPDGYPELIFHYGDPYQINISGEWEIQSKELIAGQIRNHFFLKNTGESKMFSIQFQPWAIKEIFGFEMSLLVDKVLEIPSDIKSSIELIKEIAIGNLPFEEKVESVSAWFLEMQNKAFNSKYKAVEHIHQKNGLIQLEDLSRLCETSERTIERYFKSYIGLSPKFYSRIIRFSSIFKMIQEEEIDWQDIVYKAGYYDQSHFIKNFKEFTGEDPSKYGFSSQNMANFFLKK
ncbi:MAG: helix-turn-helix transcriptional regulator [Flavobacteriaceae bacterium]